MVANEGRAIDIKETPASRPQNLNSLKKPYSKPIIIHELDLETRAGSPIPPNLIPPFFPPRSKP
jgi:hypothetical protein